MGRGGLRRRRTDFVQSDGRVVATYEATGLLAPDEAARADILNGIAHDPATGRFYLTGKWWPKLFEVELPEPPR